MLVGAGIWLARSWLSERLKNSIRAEYDQKLETHKAQLKSQSDIAIERLRADLSIATAEHNIQFARLHEKRAEVIAETYARLTELHYWEKKANKGIKSDRKKPPLIMPAVSLRKKIL